MPVLQHVSSLRKKRWQKSRISPQVPRMWHIFSRAPRVNEGEAYEDLDFRESECFFRDGGDGMKEKKKERQREVKRTSDCLRPAAGR